MPLIVIVLIIYKTRSVSFHAFTLILVCLDKEEVYFFDICFLKMEFLYFSLQKLDKPSSPARALHNVGFFRNFEFFYFWFVKFVKVLEILVFFFKQYRYVLCTCINMEINTCAKN